MKYIDADKLKYEIKRRLNILTNVYTEQVERKDEEMMNYYHGKVIALEELRPFLDTLSEEPDIPKFPETFEICLYDGRTPDSEKCTGCSTTCSVRKEEPNKSLEEAAEEYAKDYEVGPNRIAIKAFIAGAEWGAEHLRDSTKMIDGSLEEEISRTYHDGSVTDTENIDHVTYDNIARHFAEWQKSQMLKNAVEGEVMTNGFYPYEPRIVAPYPNCPYAFGDKVKVIVLKDNEDESK